MIYATPFLLLNVDACDWNFVLTDVVAYTLPLHTYTSTHTYRSQFANIRFSLAHSMGYELSAAAAAHTERKSIMPFVRVENYVEKVRCVCV